jgi:hypothetical protein
MFWPYSELLTFLNPKVFCDLFFYFFPRFKSIWIISKFQNHWTLMRSVCALFLLYSNFNINVTKYLTLILCSIVYPLCSKYRSRATQIQTVFRDWIVIFSLLIKWTLSLFYFCPQARYWNSVRKGFSGTLLLKGQCHEIFGLWFFSPINPT